MYWLEDIDLKGKRTWHGPVSPVESVGVLPENAQAVLLSQLNRERTEEELDLSRREALQARLRQNQQSAVSSQQSAFSPQPPFFSSRSSPRANIDVVGLDDGKGTFQGPLPRAVISDRARMPAVETQESLAGSSAVKLFIQKEGWYRVSQAEILASGLDPKVNPRHLQLFADGREQPILVTGQGEPWGPQGAMEFYGRGLDTPSTDTRVYWLTVGSRPGKRVSRMAGDPGSGGTAESFPFTVEKRERIYYIAALRNGGREKFFGAVVSPEAVEQILNVAHLDPSPPGEASLEVVLQGLADGPHRVQVLLNGVDLGPVVFSGQGRGSLRVPVSQATGLREGENVVRLVAQGGEPDISLVDYLRLTYWHTYTAEGDLLRCSAWGGQGYTIDGFSSSRVRVMDITEPERGYEIGGVIEAKGSGYSIRFRVPNPGERTLLAFTEERVEKPGALEANHPSGWHGAENEADLVIITTENLMESVRPMKVLREGQGLSVALVDVEDIYDEFSFGIKNPQAIKDFLSRAKTSWQRPPRYVLLAGEGTLDPRNYQGYGSFDWVPTKLVETAYLETASDDWFVDFDGDGLPEMAIGRLPVRTVEEMNEVVAKIVGYEQLSSPMREVLFVADMRGGEDDYDFEGASGEVEGLLSGGVSVSRIYRSQFGDDTRVGDELLGGMNGGKLWVNYLGHGSVQMWRGGIFDAQAAGELTNGLRLPFVAAMTCLNGFFHDPAPNESVAGALLKAAGGGAVAVWASSGLTEPGGQVLMNKELVRLLFSGESLTIGEATLRAKAATTDGDVRRTWILFGDPTTRLRYEELAHK